MPLNPYEDKFDYYESVTGVCRVTGCGWEVTLEWSDFEHSLDDGTSPARKVYMEHWNEKHAEGKEHQIKEEPSGQIPDDFREEGGDR